MKEENYLISKRNMLFLDVQTINLSKNQKIQ